MRPKGKFELQTFILVTHSHSCISTFEKKKRGGGLYYNKDTAQNTNFEKEGGEKKPLTDKYELLGGGNCERDKNV